MSANTSATEVPFTGGNTVFWLPQEPYTYYPNPTYNVQMVFNVGVQVTLKGEIELTLSFAFGTSAEAIAETVRAVLEKINAKKQDTPTIDPHTTTAHPDSKGWFDFNREEVTKKE